VAGTVDLILPCNPIDPRIVVTHSFKFTTRLIQLDCVVVMSAAGSPCSIPGGGYVDIGRPDEVGRDPQRVGMVAAVAVPTSQAHHHLQVHV
jgi:hypothetical protein